MADFLLSATPFSYSLGEVPVICLNTRLKLLGVLNPVSYAICCIVFPPSENNSIALFTLCLLINELNLIPES